MMSVLRLCALILSLAFGALSTGAALTVPMAHAQTAPATAPDYTAWERVATRADEAIEAGRASTTALEQLRTELVGWRDQFTAAQGANANAIATVQSQLETLGPPPEEGEEPAEVAAQRAQLNARLSDLRAPVKVAELAFSRADGLIKGIDQIIRDRQTAELLQLGPSPVNPANWGRAVSSFTTSATNIRNEFTAAWSNPVQREESRSGWPFAVLLALIGIVLLARGRYWVERMSRALWASKPTAARWVMSFGLSLGEMLLPFLGIYAISEAIYATGLVGLRGDILLKAIVPATFAFYVARWIALRMFPRNKAQTLPLNLEDGDRTSGRFTGAALGLVVGANIVLNALADLGAWGEASRNVIIFPVLVVAGLLLLQVSRLLRLHVKAGAEAGAGGDTEESYRDRMVRLLSRALMLLAVVGPLLAAVGYFKAGEFLMIPSIISLGLLAALVILQRLISEVYVLLSGNREGVADSLVPVLMGFLLVMASVPIFALIWGARVADLTELWTTFTQGVYVGETRISPTVFLTFALVFVAGYMATRLVQGALKNSVLPKTKLDAGGRNAVVSGVGYIGIFLAALVAITAAGIDLSSIAIVAGALSVGIGFGLQNIVSNFVSGIILLIERPISEGDWIEVGGTHGTVRDISVRSTRIETFDRSDVIVPNADLVSGTVTNYTRGKTVGRIILPVGVAYGTDTRKVHAILQEIAESHPMVLANPAPYVYFAGFGADSLDFEIRAILRDINWGLSVKTELNHRIAEKFTEDGIEIPFAQRDIWIRNPEALGPGAAPANVAASPDSSSGVAHMTAEDLDNAPDGEDADK